MNLKILYYIYIFIYPKLYDGVKNKEDMKKITFLKLSKIICPAFYKYYNSIIEKNRILELDISDKDFEIKSFKSCLNFIESIKNSEKKEFLGLTYNKNTNRYAVIYLEEDVPPNEYNIIVEEFIRNIHQVVYKLEGDFCKKERRIYIIDNHSLIYRNEGYGSIGLEGLTTFAERNNYLSISGSISPVDWDHVDILKHFYEKQSFNVYLDYEKKMGNIKWENPKQIKE